MIISNSRSGELVILGVPQSEIEKFVFAAKTTWPRATVYGLGSQSQPAMVTNCPTNSESIGNIRKPVPLGIPVYNFQPASVRSEKPIQQPAVQNRRVAGKPEPLGIPVMVFNRNRQD